MFSGRAPSFTAFARNFNYKTYAWTHEIYQFFLHIHKLSKKSKSIMANSFVFLAV